MYKKGKYFQFCVILLHMTASSAFGSEDDNKESPSTGSPKKIHIKKRVSRGYNHVQSSPTSDLISRQKKQVENQIHKSNDEKGRQKREELLLKKHNHEGFKPFSRSLSVTSTFSSSLSISSNSSLDLILEEAEEENGGGIVTSLSKETGDMSNTNQPPLNAVNQQQSALEEDKKLF